MPWSIEQRTFKNLAYVRAEFPRLADAQFVPTSEIDPAYNCIAWAVGYANAKWWPWPLSYWPPGAPKGPANIATFMKLFESLGFEQCGHDAEIESGFEKIAIFHKAISVTHAARQLPNGRWTSKMGNLEDIEHGLRDVEGDEYGELAVIMKRPILP